MDTQNASGPSSTAPWVEMQVGAGAGRPLTLLLTQAASGTHQPATAATSEQPASYFYLPKLPRLVRDGQGRPVFALTLLLSRRPLPQDETIFDLIQQGTLTLQLALDVPAATVAQLPG